MRYYTKRTAIEGHDKAIPTSLPAHTADLMIQDHAILRPFALQLAAVVMKSSPDCVRRYRDCLFVNYDSDFEAKTITTLMGRHSRKEETLGWPMNVNAYRHINVAFRRHHCQPIEHLMESDNEDTIGALQAGHTAKVAREHYAISNEIIEGRIAEEVLPLYLDYSGDFQRVLHIVPGGQFMHYKKAIDGWDSYKPTKSTNSTPTLAPPSTVATVNTGDIVTQLMQQLGPLITTKIDQGIQEVKQAHNKSMKKSEAAFESRLARTIDEMKVLSSAILRNALEQVKATAGLYQPQVQDEASISMPDCK